MIAIPPHYDGTEFYPTDTVSGQTYAGSWLGGATMTTGSFPGDHVAMWAGPTSPYGTGWNLVHVPYTTGDVYAGDAVRTYTTTLRDQNITYTFYHKGYSNVRLDLARLKRDFPNPSTVLLTGASAGGMGAHCNLSQVVQTWPNVKTYMFSEVGFPHSPPEAPKIADTGQTWGAWHEVDGKAVADTCPIEPSPGVTPWGFRNAVRYNSLHFPNVRQGFTDDYSDNTMEPFMCMLQSTNTIDYCFSGAAPDYSPLLQSTMNEMLDNDVNANGPNPNFKVFIHPGTCHNENEFDGNSLATTNVPASCDYDKMKQSGVHFNDWFRGFAGEPGFKWEDIK
jgi:hypothetical protein